ncbi:uncharacterized protein Dwil_GK17497 [Drosophila willistoni]|uniref:Ionotropic glutamate receptor C-terminal domain-containing protein n=1 Tax=Drosophila willistoni TaxID=7260 RepID=B4MMJ5_DROWI|nr:uncharacterized protein Dwil_GK17497 [Drosophila willistoni]
MLVLATYWSTVLTYLAKEYLLDSTYTTCILWHSEFDFKLDTYVPLAMVIMNAQTWHNDDDDNLIYKMKREEFTERGIPYNNWILTLTVALERNHCESFIVFQEQISEFAHYFYNASIYSIWRSTRSRFIFAYTNELFEDEVVYFNDYIFHDQPHILLVNAEYLNSSIFHIKTNRFVGPRDFKDNPESVNLYTLQLYDALNQEIMWQSDDTLSSKLQNLQGREMVIGVFDYEPFMVVTYEGQPKFYDRALDKPQVAIDGTDIRLMLIFCERYNCTIQADTTETSDWGYVYPNATGLGLVGMIMDRRNDFGIGGMYLWLEAYQTLDMTHFLGRSAVTCLVPSPNRRINWALPLEPFQAMLWLSVMLCLVMESLALAIARRFEDTMVTGKTGSSQGWQGWAKSIQFACVSTLKLFVNQSTSYITVSYTLRTILLASYMIDIILTTLYGGGLAAILTLPSFEEAADSRQRLYQHKLTWTGTSQVWITTIDSKSADPVLMGIMNQFRVYEASKIASYSRSEEMAFVLERVQFGHLANSEPIPNDALDRLKLMVDDIYFSLTVAYVPRLWPFLNVYNDYILAWHSSGFDKYWEWKIAADYMSAHRQNRMLGSQKLNLNLGPVKLGLDNFIGLIMLWLMGMVCSLLAFLAELWCISGQKNLPKQSNNQN